MEPWQTTQTNLTDIPIAQELSRRTPRSPDLQAENRALQILARQLATSPHTLLKTLVAIAQDLCSAGSVGVCLLAENVDSEQIWRWEALAGAWEAAEHTNTPQTLRLSGAGRDLQTPQLYLNPERYFPDLPQLEMPIAEALVVPLLAENQPLGAIWIVSHDSRQFDVEDLRIAIALADFAVAALKIDRADRTASALRDRETHLQLILDSAKDYTIITLDTGGHLTSWNAGAERMLGYAEAEIIGRHGRIIFTPEDSAARKPELEMHLALTEGKGENERWHLRKDGSRFWGSGLVMPLRDAAGELQGFLKIMQDKTDSKQTQLHEQFLSGLQLRLPQCSNAAEMLWEAMKSLGEYLNVDRCIWHEIDAAAQLAIVDRDWHQPGLVSIAGTYQISDFKTAELTDICIANQPLVISDIANYPDTASLVDNYGGLGIHALVDVPCLQGERWVAVLVVTSQAVRHWQIDEVSLMQEMVARLWTAILHARTLQDLQESEDRFRALADNIAQLAWMTDATGWIFWYNQRWFDYTGTTLEEMQGWGWHQVHHPEHVDRVVEKFRRCMETGEAWEDTFPLRGTDGSYRWFLSRAVPMRDEQSNVLRWCGTNTDITDRLNAEAERERLLALEKATREEAERANRVKDEFLAVLSHELRTPLNPILGWSKLLRSNSLTPEKQRYALETIERNAKLQTQLIEDLLDVSGILQGKVSLNIVPVDLAGAIGNAIETVRLSAQVKSIQICTEFALDLGRVLGDGGRLQQVVWNLLSNAVKFTSPGGKIAVKLDRIDNDAQITVTDTGKGIAADFLPCVFDYFRQADSTFTRKFGGLGLGLAIVRHLVELHGGTVKADSAGEGQGATFTVRIPLMPVQPPTIPAQTAPEKSFNLSGIRVLVVDDDADARDLVVFLLEDCGATVTAVANAADALVALTVSVPDMLLSDIGMPDTDGYMLLRQVRALPPEQGGLVPAIALTAYAGEIDYQQALAVGFGRHISKPLDPDKFVQAMLDLLVDRSNKNIF
ncbi:MAG: PAS domain S-box protein [Microcoleus sp. CAN_BIN18]|nr:PAS domain S-box protein [Microcoleus sp. CAN_BIN18]